MSGFLLQVQPLVIGQEYFISFYTVFSEGFIGGSYFSMPSNNIGLRLSTVAYNSSNPAPIDNFAHLNYSTILNDSINWTRVSGSLIADASYNYLVLGNFFTNSNTDTMHYSCGSCLNSGSYYYIDDICISTDSTLCNGGIDALPCVVSVNEIDNTNEVLIYPNPTSDLVTVSLKSNKSVKIILYDVLGKIVLSDNIKNSNSINMNLAILPPGYYSLKITDEITNSSITKKIIKL